MEWYDDGIIVSLRPYGENSAIVSVMTRQHGYHAGFVHRASLQSQRSTLLLGNYVQTRWHGRLQEQLGYFSSFDLIRSYMSKFFWKVYRLRVLKMTCTLLCLICNEREEEKNLFDGFLSLLNALAQEDSSWLAVYVEWEVYLLKVFGFGLDLSKCAVTGTKENLLYVSPRTGRAVCGSVGEQYKHRLLHLPCFLTGQGLPGYQEIAVGLQLSGFFLERHILQGKQRHILQERKGLFERILNQSVVSCVT